MKYITLLILLISSLTSYAQHSKKEILIQEVDDYVKTVNKAADQFLNKTLSTTERISAIEPYEFIYDSSQIGQFKKIVLDDKEEPVIRAAALSKIYEVIADDEKLWSVALVWLSDPATPKVLRQSALDMVSNSSLLWMNVPDVYQKMLEDPDPEFRLFAFTQLIIHGDARAQQKLIDGLENPQSALLPAPTAISVLSMALKKEYYPALYNVLRQTKDEATRLEAIRALGSYKPAREDLITIMRSANEKEQLREAALDALFASDRDNIVQYASSILPDKSATLRLKIIAIQMTIDVRQTMAYRVKAKNADSYDRLIKRIANDKNNPADLQNIAIKYMQFTRPNY